VRPGTPPQKLCNQIHDHPQLGTPFSTWGEATAGADMHSVTNSTQINPEIFTLSDITVLLFPGSSRLTGNGGAVVGAR